MEHGSINYIEFPARDIEATKTFFIQAFAWCFSITDLSILLLKVRLNGRFLFGGSSV